MIGDIADREAVVGGLWAATLQQLVAVMLMMSAYSASEVCHSY